MSIFTVCEPRLLVLASVTALLGACANGPSLPPEVITTPPIIGDSDPAPVMDPSAITYVSSGNDRIDDWREDFSARALAKGHDRDIVEDVLSGLKPLTIWLGSNVQVAQTGIGDQAEFAKPIWDYLRVPIGNTRIGNGKAKLAEFEAKFDRLEALYGVDREVLVSIWGMETSYGGFPLSFDAPNALANMAVEGRRQTYAEGELYALMKIIKQGHAGRDDLAAGYAGAMGQTQFMPSTYLAYAVDVEGDGKRDVWDDTVDALGSAANYLKVSGYTMGEPWGIEVLIPDGFDYSLGDGKERRMSTWTNAGLTPMGGGAFETGTAEFAQLWLPAGHEGPKYLLFNNFKVFRTYNRADSYAFAIGLAADAYTQDRAGPVAAWPTHLAPLSVGDIKQLQAGLNSRGYSAGPVDGIPGRQTRTALQAFQKAEGLIADGYPTQDVLARLTGGANFQGASSSSN